MSKILSAHQPNYFPSLSYFHKIKNSDVFIFLDNVRFSKQSFTQRNKIRTQENTEYWLTVPIQRKSHKQDIDEVRIAGHDWKMNHTNAIRHFYKDLPHYKDVMSFIEELFKPDCLQLSVLNSFIVSQICDKLEIYVPIHDCSTFDIEDTGDRRLIELCKQTGCDTYLSGQGQKGYIQLELYSLNGIKVCFQTHSFGEKQYSIIDSLFVHGFEGCRRLLDG